MSAQRERHPAWRVSGLRARVGLLFLAWVLGTGLAFFGLLVAFTHSWLLEQLDDRTRGVSVAAAERLRVPLSFGDHAGVEEALDDLVDQPDIVGAAVYDPAGRLIAERVKDGAEWSVGTWSPPRREARSAGLEIATRVDHATHQETREYTRALDFVPAARGAATAEAGELFGLGGATSPATGKPVTLGWLRVAASTAVMKNLLTTAANAGASVVLFAFVLGLLAVSLLMRVVIGPLGEAEVLAREISAGNLSRRLPVTGPDEVGSLSASLNRMADSLEAARRETALEAGRLDASARVVLSVARQVRRVSEPRRAFEIVADHLKGLTDCDGVALALPAPSVPGRREEVRIEFLKGSIGDDALRTGFAFSPTEIAIARPDEPAATRFEPRGPRRLGRVLESAGVKAALAVALPLPEGPPAILLLASSRANCFEDWHHGVIDAVTTHLLDALQASQLKQRLEGAFAELDRTRDSLLRTQNLRLASEMASGAAHDFNNVLGAILGRAQLLKRQHAAGDLAPESLVRALDVIEMAAKDGSETVRRLREFGKSRDGTLAESVDVGQAMRDAVEFTRSRWEDEAQAAGLTLKVEVDAPAALCVLARPGELRELITNLVLNAADAIRVTGTIRLAARADGDSVRIEVADDGAGMTPDVEARIFEPFFTTKGPRGTGMGLSVVYGIVQRLGGTISVKTAPGHGATFSVGLPRVAAVATTPAQHAAVATEPAPTALRVLVVDDEPAVRDLLGDIVTALGHAPTVSSEPVSIAASFVPGSYDLVLTDVGMPEMNGWQLTAMVRAIDPNVPIALVTGWGEEIGADQVRDAGADAVIAKPFTVEDLAEILAVAERRRPPRAA
jgi:signal transduction histidine kinase/CheY-like chemotaxis protein/HAMP domain-containing protein